MALAEHLKCGITNLYYNLNSQVINNKKMGTFHFLENASFVKLIVGEIKPLIQILGDELVLAAYPYFTSYI